MRVVVQRVQRASVTCEGELTGSIAKGLLVLVGFLVSDTEAELAKMAAKIAKLRVFDDEAGVMNRSLVDAGGELLCVSQFTLYAKTKKGNRPAYVDSAPAEVAEPLYERFMELLAQEIGKPVARGKFGGEMQVELVNDGPVTIIMDSLGDLPIEPWK
ncbi:MAG: D-tyrosyl-tRNA(Tyr) deacylase [Bacteroidetes bacterium]|nr:MAG: D-tyrosyl-tRNA(Tyr) deacylase [Bacteroidota bacterium]